MTYVVFRTKTEVFAFIEQAHDYAIGCKVVSVPKELKIGCGLAAGISDNNVYRAKKLVQVGDYPTFYGIFTQKYVGTRSILSRLS